MQKVRYFVYAYHQIKSKDMSDKSIVIAITGRAGAVSRERNKNASNISNRQVWEKDTKQFYIFLPEQFLL